MPKTYDLISTTTLSSAASSLNITGIPATYTDLRLVATGVRVSGGALAFRFNNDSGSKYHYLRYSSNGSSLSSAVTNSATEIGTNGWNTTYPQIWRMDLLGYTSSNKKSCLLRMAADELSGGENTVFCATYDDTTVISQINLFITTGTIAAGFTASLYGILRA